MKKRIVTVLKWIGLAIVALGVLYAVLLGASNRSLRRAYSAMEADGRPMKAEQIIPANIPDTDNAALVYEAVVLQLKAEQAGEKDMFSEMNDLAAKVLKETPPAEATGQFRKLIQKEVFSDALLMIEKGAAKPGCRYDLDYSKGVGILLPHISDLRGLSRMLCATSRIQAANGDHAAAWTTVITSLRLSDAMKNEPFLISQLVRIAQFSLTANTIQSLCANAPLTAEQYVQLAELLPAFEENAPFVSAMDGERLLLGEWAFNLPQSELWKTLEVDDDRAWRFFLRLAVTFNPLFRRDHAAYLNIMHAYAQNAKEPYSAEHAVLGEQMMNDVPRYCILTRMFTPALWAVKGRYVFMIAQARVTRAGLAVLHHRQKHQTYPDNLAALNKQDLIDPFSGKPLSYFVAPTGFTVYSIGENLVDDGGKKTKDRRAGDIVWRYTE